MSLLAPVPTFACRMLTGELLAVEGTQLIALHPITHKVVWSYDLASCDSAKVEMRRGVGSRAVDRVLLPLVPLFALAASVLFAEDGVTRWASSLLIALVSWIALVVSRRQVAPALVLRRGGSERLLALAFGGGLDELTRVTAARVGRRHPLADERQLAAAKERVRRYASWSGNRLGGGAHRALPPGDPAGRGSR